MSKKDHTVGNILFGPDATNKRIKQLELNQRYMIAKFDELHAILCPNKHGTWQQRVEQVVNVVQQLKSSIRR